MHPSFFYLMKKEKAMNILLPKMMVVENTEEPVVSQYDRLAGGNPGFNPDAHEKDLEVVGVDLDSLKLVNTRAALFKLADKLPDSWYKRELMRLAHNMPKHLMSYGVFLVRKHIKPNFTPYGVEYVLSSWFKAVPGPYEWWYQITIVKDKKYDQVWHHEPILRIKDK